MTVKDAKRLGFHYQNKVVPEYVYRCENSSIELVISTWPLNEQCMFIRMPDDSLIQVNPDSIEDIEALQRMLKGAYCENVAEAWFPTQQEN